MGMAEKPRILVLDLLESFARERNVNIHIERRKDRPEWVCTLTNGVPVRASGDGAREAIRTALQQVGVDLP